MITRREFISNTGILTAGFCIGPSASWRRPVRQIGLQMYTVRNVIEKDVRGVIVRIAEVGYKELEIAGYSKDKKFWGMEPKPFKQLLDSNGLIAPSGHFGFEKFFTDGDDGDIKIVLEAAKIAGQEYVTVSYLGEQYRKSINDYKKIANKLNIAGELCKQAGLQLAYHNHDFEFKKFDDGKVGYDVLLNDTDKDLVKFELDLFWTTKAGKDPVKMFEENPGRFPMWHVKDLDKATQTFTEVGAGCIDFKRIFEKEKLSGVKHIFIEQDIIMGDVFESIEQSYSYVKDNLI